MAYQVLARKWRPQDFSSIVGQEPIVTALRNALTEDRIAQAYLFSGIRGVGKTTAARVLAKALSCEKGPAADPCNECTVCLEITAGTALDFIEVDAATYSKVEQIRELTESLRYGAARNRYKVVVLDEVHRLSRQAFDALLKIVEEPPPHLVFIFATTEIDAVPATILSRCQEFQFRRVPSPRLAALLREICQAENITATDAGLRLIARAGEGSVRDSVALLDQLATFGAGQIRDQDAQDLLGGLDTEVFFRVLTAMLTGDRSAITAVVHEIDENGWDPHHVYGQFLTYVRDALHLALDGREESVDLPQEEARRLAEQVRSTGYENLLRLAQLLLSSEQTVRRSEFGGLALEIAWLRAAELPKLQSIEEILQGKTPMAAAVAAGSPSAAMARSPRATQKLEKTVTGSPELAAEPSPGPPPPAVPSKTSSGELPRADDAAADPARVEMFLATLRARHQPLAAHFRHVERLEFAAGDLHIYQDANDSLLQQACQRNGSLLQEILAEVWGPESGWQIHQNRSKAVPPVVAPAEAVTEIAPPATIPAKTPSTVAAASFELPPTSPATTAKKQHDHPAVQAVLDIFGGTIESTRSRSSHSSDKES